MARYESHDFEIPAETIEVAQAAFPKGNTYLIIRDKLGPLFKDETFAELFSWQGQTGVSPSLLATVTILQFAEGLTDRQTAEAVRSRIDWKYMLGLELRYAGFDHSILSPFRDRLLAGGQEGALFDQALEHLKGAGLFTGKNQQRTDSTHVLAAIRSLNRLECVGEAIRRVLDDLARIAPDWLVGQITPDWFDRYGKRFDAYRLPDKKTERSVLQQQIGLDGQYLLQTIYTEKHLAWLAELPAVEGMRQIWVQQYVTVADQLRWRTDKEIPPHKLLIISPDDLEARNRTKRETNWNGYAVHLSETCAAETPHLITNVETTPATTVDVEVTDTIHQALADKDLLPQEHLVDAGYTAVDQLLHARQDYQIDLIGPVAGGGSWQAKAGKGFDVTCFAIDWDAQTVTCPKGHPSQSWHPRQEKYGHSYIQVRFAPTDCQPCPHRSDCTRSKLGVRLISFKPQLEYETLKHARERQQTPAFQQTYNKRAGIEGTISQATRAFGLRQSRYLGLAKTHLQHLASAAAMNLSRAVSWWLADENPPPLYQSPFAKLKPNI